MNETKTNIVINNQTRIEDLLIGTKRKGINQLVDWLRQSDFYTAPASTRPGFHGCYVGGLAQHSLNVYDVFENKIKFLQLENNLNPDERIVASICHDFCKVDLYKNNKLASGEISSSKPYVVKDIFPLGHGEKSVVAAQNLIDLTSQEMLLIRWHMGTYDPSWDRYDDKIQKACPLITAFHNSDNEASKYLD